MSENLHPSQLQSYLIAYFRARYGFWLSVAVAIALFSSGVANRKHRPLLMGSSLVMLAVAEIQRKQYRDIQRYLTDIQEVSEFNFRNYLKTQTSPQSPMVVNVGEFPSESIKYFDWSRFGSEPDTFPHIRCIGKTGSGKTTLGQWIISEKLRTETIIISAKRKPTDFKGFKVFGEKFNYSEAESKILEIHKLMYDRYELIDQGIKPEPLTVVIDEAKLIINKCSDKVSNAFKDFAVVARDAGIRIFGLAQGTQVKHWGLEGESDISECFTDILIGQFAIDKCLSLRNKHRVNSPEYQYWNAVLTDLQTTGKRCCMVGDEPATIPNLTNSNKPNILPTSEVAEPAQLLPNSKTDNELNEYEQAIIDAAKKLNGDVLKARTIKQNSRLFKDMDSNDIRIIFQSLADKGIGQTEGEADRLSFKIKSD